MSSLARPVGLALGVLTILGVVRLLTPSGSSSGRARRDAAADRVAAAHQEPPATITFVGDIMLASRVGRVAAAAGAGHLLAGVAKTLRADDLTIGNLECAVATTGTPADKQYTFLANPGALPGLSSGGLDAVSLANNHSLDYGRPALRATLENLRRAGIQSAGAGLDSSQAVEPAILPAGSQTVALVAGSQVLPAADWRAGAHRPGIASAYDPAAVVRRIRLARPAADIVVVYLHWGKEHTIVPKAYQRALARRYIDAGADAVIGSHPHVLQGFEYYRGRLIAYSLGNFVFTNHGKTTALLQATFRKGVLEGARVIPCRILSCRPQIIADPNERKGVLRALQQRSYGVSIGEDGSLSSTRDAEVAAR